MTTNDPAADEMQKWSEFARAIIRTLIEAGIIFVFLYYLGKFLIRVKLIEMGCVT